MVGNQFPACKMGVITPALPWAPGQVARSNSTSFLSQTLSWHLCRRERGKNRVGSLASMCPPIQPFPLLHVENCTSLWLDFQGLGGFPLAPSKWNDIHRSLVRHIGCGWTKQESPLYAQSISINPRNFGCLQKERSKCHGDRTDRKHWDFLQSLLHLECYSKNNLHLNVAPSTAEAPVHPQSSTETLK